MAVDKQPLQSSTAHNSAGAAAAPAKTIEETYQKKTQLEHILLRPDTYIGSVERHTQDLWVFEEETMVHRRITYVPGLYKIFDEILVNAADNKQRDPSMDSLKVEIDAEACQISVYNNGDGVPVEIHADEGVYVPELIFGHLLTSSNYDDGVKKTTGGRNGYGAKLTNIFSTEFVIETADGKRQKKYKQVFSNNMGKKSEPNISKCKQGDNWTKVTFKPDLAKFNMTNLEDDVVALMKKRVIDLAGTMGKTVKVELNGKRVPVKTFADYVNLYLQTASRNTTEPLPRVMERVNDRWEICISLSEGFQQVSFVNSISTIKGGSHVDNVTSQITSHIISLVNKKNKTVSLKPHNVKNHLWVFVNALIDNPAFDSQTKETLTTRAGSFGSKCELSPEFLKKVSNIGLVDNLLSWADFKQNKDLKKTDGAKRVRISGIHKLEDANDAGSAKSYMCTLILTEGDSAKALAMAGISVVGRDHYGVFPLRGKLLNVRDASHKQIMDNAEIQHLKQILGLQHGKTYEDTRGLRYGHLMIMTDQDHDGSHIKGLVINFIHSFWPSLLKIPSFMLEFITPIVKATSRTGKILSFYTMPEYESWKETQEGKSKGWSIKYYKGLGTSTSKEGKEYFSDLGKHKKDFKWEDAQDGDSIEMAFSKKKVEARKSWLRQFEPGTYLDQSKRVISYSEFVNKELILFSLADLQRSIPSMIDGLKPGQRKILFCSFKRKFVKECKVAQFSGYVSEHSAYHHGEQSLAGTIIGMAQDFVGSNNVNLLQPNGQFGTRHQGGKDHASARYIFTCLSPLTRILFSKDDDGLLNHLVEDGQKIEPTWYIPIIPLILVNGSEGIGTGWSSFVPNYNPRDIVANVKRLLNNEPLLPMDPWYRGFKGLIEKSATSKVAGVTYNITGIIEEVDSTTLRITELPIRKWTQDYKEFLETLMLGSDKMKETFIKDFREHNDDTNVYFEVTLSEENLILAKQEGLEKKFKLTTTMTTSNMHLFDSNGVIKKYETPEQILEEFFPLRLEFYERRKKKLLDDLKEELFVLDNKVRFILGVVHGEIIVNNRKKADLCRELQQKNFAPRKEEKDTDAAASETVEDEENAEGSPKEANGGITGYDYLLAMKIRSLTLEEVQKLCDKRRKLEEEVDVLEKTSLESLWLKDLDDFEACLDERDRADAESDKVKYETRMTAIHGGEKKAQRKPRKATTAAMDIGDENEGKAKPKPGSRPKKAQAKLVNEDGEEDDEVFELKNRLAAHNIDSSPEKAAMEVEKDVPPQRKAPIRRRAAPAKKNAASSTATEISEDDGIAMATIPEQGDDDDEDFGMEQAAAPKGKNKGGGRKPAMAAAKGGKAAATEARKRATEQKKSTSSVADPKQKLLPDMMPQTKVRRMRDSPFNKKSGSILGRTAALSLEEAQQPKAAAEAPGAASSSDGSPDVEPMVARAARPARERKNVVTYVESDSEGAASEESEEIEISDSDEDEE